MSDIFREVDEDLRQEEYARLWKRYGAFILAGCLAVVLVAAGQVAWRNYQAHVRQAASLKYQTIVRAGEEDAPELTAETVSSLRAIERQLTPGYRTLSKFERAAAAVELKNSAEAVALYDAIAGEKTVSQGLRDIAALKSAYLQAEALSLTDMRARVEPLAAPESAFRFSANELLGYVAYRNGDYKAARGYYQAILSDPSAPGNLLKRSQDMASLVAAHLEAPEPASAVHSPTPPSK